MLHRVIDLLDAHLTARLPVGTKVVTSTPQLASDLPAVVLALRGCQPVGSGVGGKPRGVVEGALRVDADIDLASPVLSFPDDTVTLLSPDRLVLQLPHSPLVNADGVTSGPLAIADARLRLGATTFALTAAAPAAGEVRIERDTGVCTFGAPLPATGVLDARYFLGSWEVDTIRLQGELVVDCFADSAAAVDTLSRAVAELLRRGAVAGLDECVASDWGAIDQPSPTFTAARRRSLAYRFRCELDEPLVATGGGPIRSVAVTLTPFPGALPTTFQIPPT